MNSESKEFDKNLALFYFAYRSFTKTSDNLVAKYCISKVHRRILFFIARMPGLTVKELLTVLDISKQALNRPMQELLKKELVITKTNNDDKRSKLIYLTEKGKELDFEISNVQKKEMEDIFAKSGDPSGQYWIKVMIEYAKGLEYDFIDYIDKL